MIRHGQASFGAENYDQLSARGLEQSRILAEYLLRTGSTFDTIYSGEMERQKDTALALISTYGKNGNHVPELSIAGEFNEYNSKDIITAHILEIAEADPTLKEQLKDIYTDKKAFQRFFEEIVRRWVSGKYYKPGINTWEDFKAKVQGGLQRIREENGHGRSVIVFTSGGPISVAVQTALGLSDEATMRLAWGIVNASLTKFIYDEERMTLASFNVTSHLELTGDASLITYR